MDVGKYIKSLRLNKGMTQEELGNFVGVKRAAVQKWESGLTQNLKRTTIQKLAEIFNVPGSSFIENSTNIKLAEFEDTILIPNFGEVAAGLGCYADGCVKNYEPFSKSSVHSGYQYICLEVEGDSMYPILIEGDIILVKCVNSVDSGSLAVVTIDGDEGVVKKVVYGSTWIELHSINPMYPVRRFEGAEVMRIKVIGLVAESKRKF